MCLEIIRTIEFVNVLRIGTSIFSCWMMAKLPKSEAEIQYSRNTYAVRFCYVGYLAFFDIAHSRKRIGETGV